MSRTERVAGLDVGAARIGVATADANVRIAVPYGAVKVDGREVEAIARLVESEGVSTVVVGYPRNQSGEATAQTSVVEAFAERLKGLGAKIEFQDESLTSILAEQRLKARKQEYAKADIDVEAAVIILQDYLERTG